MKRISDLEARCPRPNEAEVDALLKAELEKSPYKIIVLDDGDAVGIGKHEELLCACPVYREIYDSQFKNGGGNE